MTNVLFTDDLVQLKCGKCFRPTAIKHTSILIFHVGGVLNHKSGWKRVRRFAHVVVLTHFKGKHATN